MKTKTLELFQEEDKWEGVKSQELSDENGTVFYVYNLTFCPEDATISRDLFDVDDYIKAVKYGIKLAKQGYDDVEYKTV